MTWWKYEIGLWTGKCRLTQIQLNKRKRLFLPKNIIPCTHFSLFFNNSLIQQAATQKHLSLKLDQKLTFQYHVNEKIKKSMKGIGLLRKLQPVLPRTSLLTIYKSFIITHLDYGDVAYDQPSIDAFSNKLKTIQTKCSFSNTRAIKGTSGEKLYRGLGLKYLQQRRWMRRLWQFCKVVSTK